MTGSDRLYIAAAVTSGWPVVHVHTRDETTMLAARERIEAAVGPLPQTDEIEPWDPNEPAWELRIALPGASVQTLAAVALAAGPDEVVVHAGPTPGLMHDIDTGRPFRETTTAGPLTAALHFDPEDGGSGRMDLRRCAADPNIEDLDRDVALALQAHGVTAPFRSHRGNDTVGPVVHRPSGRLGARLAFPPDVEVDRDAVLAAQVPLVQARAEHDTLRLAPDMRWDVDDGLALTLWFIAPRGPRLPTDRIDAPARGEVTALLQGLDAAVPEVEVQVVPAHPEHADAVVDAVKDFPLPTDALTGTLPRWVGSPPRFAPCWRLDPGAVGPRVVDDWVQRLQADPRIEAVRVVPAAPRGLEARWASLEPAWRVVAGTVFRRIRDPLLDVDRLPERHPAATPDWATGLSTLPGVQSVRGFTGADESEMAMLMLVDDAVHETVLDTILAAVASQRPIQTRPVVWWAYQGDRASLCLSRMPNGPKESP